MPDPVSEALQPAFAFAPLRRGRFDQSRSARPAVPGFRRRPGPPSSPSVGSNRTQAPDPPRLALARKDKPSGNDRLRGPPVRSKPRSAFPRECIRIEGEPCNLVAPSSQPSNRSEPRSLRHRTFDAKQAPRLDPFAASNRSQAPTHPPPDLRTRSKLLVLDPSRHSRGANSVALPPDLSPGSELPDTGPFATWRQGEPCIFRRRVIRSRASPRTSTLRSLEPKQAPVLSLPDRTQEPKSPPRPVSRTSGSKRTSTLLPPDLAKRRSAC